MNILLLYLLGVLISSTIGLRDRLLDAVHMADVDRVKELLKEKDSGILTSELPISVTKSDKEYGRTSLLNCGLDPQKDGLRLLDMQCTEIAKLLHEAGANLNHVDKHGWNAVAFASVKGFSRMIDFLIGVGVPFDIPDEKGRTPLMKAAAHGFLPVVQILYNNRANISVADEHGWTSLHYIVRQAAADAAFLPTCSFIVAKISGTSQIDARDKSGRTALMYAVAEGSLAVVDMLLLNGADARRSDDEGHTVLDLAKNLDINRRITEWNIKRTLEEHEQWLRKSEFEIADENWIDGDL